MTILQLLQLLRLPQWAKASFVFLGVVYSSASLEHWFDAFLAALAFSITSSAVYIYNDLLDKDEDRLHTRKSKRPIARGAISTDFAIKTGAFCLFLGLLIALCVSKILLALLLIYLVVNLAYNFGLKNIPVLDVVCIASGFMLRVLAGTIGIGLVCSWWLLSTATLLSLLIAFAKRQLEKQLPSQTVTRKVLKKYSQKSLNIWMVLTATATLLAYLLYCFLAHEGRGYFIMTLPFAALGLGRFVWLCTQKNAWTLDDPVVLFLNDRLSCITLFCFVSMTILALYGTY